MISRRRFLQWLLSLGVVGAAMSAYAVVVEPLWRQRITRYDLKLRRWPADLPLTVAVISDLHACKPWMDVERIRSIVEQANKLNADVIVLLGDFVAGMRYYRTGLVGADEWAKALTGLKAPLGVHAILGNHDWWGDREAQKRRAGPCLYGEALKAAGFPVYENDGVRLEHQGKPFWLLGLADQIAFYDGPSRFTGLDDLAGTLAKVTDDAPVILMIHEPDAFTQVPARVALTLAGHTHGGQVRLFGYSPVVPSAHGNRFAYGHVVEDERHLIVSGGLGCSILPIRFGVPPEINLIELGA
jgi:predicted MPP superfamily phosphohydrolase